jgi:hypothetical protein
MTLAPLALSGAVTVAGAVAHHEVPAHIAAFDVAVAPHPSLEKFYFSPLKLFEYMACGVPTVGANMGQIGQLVRHGETGYLYPPGDAAALAETIIAALADPGQSRAVAWQGAAWTLAHHTWDMNAAQVIRWVRPAEEAPGPISVTTAGWAASQLPILDDRLRQRLYRATRPDLALPLLAEHLPAYRKGGAEELLGLEETAILKYKPGRRCVLAYGLVERRKRDGRVAGRKVIGKVFRDDRGLRLHDLQRRLWQDGFGPQAVDGIHVPRPLGYVPRMRMLVQELAPGTTLNGLVGGRELRSPVVRCAEAIAKLHGSTVLDGAILLPYTLESELANLERFQAELTAVRPADGAAVATLRDGLRAWAGKLSAGQTAPIHRDFYYSQVLFDWPRLTLIDFDLLALGDPAIDVANFAAHLYFLGLDHLGDLLALDGEARLFVEAYNRFRPIDNSFTERLAFYQAATFFRLLNVVAPRPGLAQHFDTLRRHTTRLLEAA